MKTALVRRAFFALAVALFFAQAARLRAAIDIQFNYTYDSSGFFADHPERQSLLNAAAANFEDRLTDTLLGIQPGASGGVTNSWSAVFDNPSTGAQLSLDNMTIGQNVIVVFVGAQQLGSTLGMGGPGGFSASGTQTFIDTVRARGQSGALNSTPTDFGPWGGALTFDSDTSWYFGSGSLSGKSDFYSVALHELAHLLGIGTAESWTAQVSGSNSQFTGPRTTQANGGIRAKLSPDLSHWAEGTTSKVFGTSITQEASMDPTLTVGTRKEFTTLDFAGLQDIGWQVVPEPSAFALLALGGLAAAAMTCGFRQDSLQRCCAHRSLQSSRKQRRREDTQV